MEQTTYIYALTPQYHSTTVYAAFKQQLNEAQQHILAEECGKAKDDIQRQMQPYSWEDVLNHALTRFRNKTAIPGYVTAAPIAGAITF